MLPRKFFPVLKTRVVPAVIHTLSPSFDVWRAHSSLSRSRSLSFSRAAWCSTEACRHSPDGRPRNWLVTSPTRCSCTGSSTYCIASPARNRRVRRSSARLRWPRVRSGFLRSRPGGFFSAAHTHTHACTHTHVSGRSTTRAPHCSCNTGSSPLRLCLSSPHFLCFPTCASRIQRADRKIEGSADHCDRTAKDSAASSWSPPLMPPLPPPPLSPLSELWGASIPGLAENPRLQVEIRRGHERRVPLAARTDRRSSPIGLFRWPSPVGLLRWPSPSPLDGDLRDRSDSRDDQERKKTAPTPEADDWRRRAQLNVCFDHLRPNGCRVGKLCDKTHFERTRERRDAVNCTRTHARARVYTHTHALCRLLFCRARSLIL